MHEVEYETLLVEVDEPVATVTVNRPEALNAINARMFDELEDLLHLLEREDEVRVVVLTGAGDRAFVAGADIKEFEAIDARQAEARSWRGMRVYDRMRHLPQPIVAMVNGYALGGGMLLALSCDVRVAAERASFGYPEIRLGVIPGTGGTVLLDRLIGAAAARALCLTGERISARRAHELGIVTHLAPDGELERVTRSVVETLAGYSPVALRELKAALNASLERDYEGARRAELEAYARCYASADRREGVRAFIEKRPPRFAGR